MSAEICGLLGNTNSGFPIDKQKNGFCRLALHQPVNLGQWVGPLEYCSNTKILRDSATVCYADARCRKEEILRPAKNALP